MNLFEKRNYIKPYEYPKMMDFVDAINSSYWTHKEYNFISDINDFKELEYKDKNDQIVIKNCLLAISQIEVSVKNFWNDIYKILPKPEVASVGSTFAESEVRHERAYSSLLEILGLNGDFKNLIKVPAIKGRVEYLEKYNNFQRKEFSERKNFLIKLTLFTLLIENVSLFTQFLIIKSYNKHLNILKGIDNVIQATQLEENIHAMFGSYLINTILEENKDWFNDDFKEIIIQACEKSYEYEKDLIIWITNKNKSSVIDFNVLDNFLKRRINQSLGMINIEPIFQENEILNERIKWFEEEILTETHTDFFNKQSVSYNKYNKNFSLEALF